MTAPGWRFDVVVCHNMVFHERRSRSGVRGGINCSPRGRFDGGVVVAIHEQKSARGGGFKHPLTFVIVGGRGFNFFWWLVQLLRLSW